jgi:hypothetical protein
VIVSAPAENFRELALQLLAKRTPVVNGDPVVPPVR